MIAILFTCLLFSVGVHCQGDNVNAELQQFRAGIHTMVEQLFTSADTNGNGHFDVEDVGSLFGTYDNDGNGLVSRDEFVLRFSNHSSFLAPVARGLFFDLDMDKNDNLDAGDVQLYYAKIDTSGDDRVTRPEFVNYFTQLFEVLFIVALRVEAATTTAAP